MMINYNIWLRGLAKLFDFFVKKNPWIKNKMDKRIAKNIKL